MATTMYFLPLRSRMVALVFPVLILAMAGVATPTFVEAGLPWWPLFIFGLPGFLAIVIAVEYWNVAIGFDAGAIHYRSVGYSVSAPWNTVSERNDGGKISLAIDRCEPHYHWWLGAMQAALSALMPGRARYAQGLMANVPLSWFSASPGDEVMTAYLRAKRQSMRDVEATD
jgi:hypothetical protein